MAVWCAFVLLTVSIGILEDGVSSFTPSPHLPTRITVRSSSVGRRIPPTLLLFCSARYCDPRHKSAGRKQRRSHPLVLGGTTNDNDAAATPPDQDDDYEIQWSLFRKHHAKGSWKGVWTTYSYMGDVMDETIASVDYVSEPAAAAAPDSTETETIRQFHTIAVGATKSDCSTCFDSVQTKTLPVATYSPDNMNRARMASRGMVNGPSLLRSGAVAIELALVSSDQEATLSSPSPVVVAEKDVEDAVFDDDDNSSARVRVVFQYAPVWMAGIEPGTGPPQGLKLYRTMISRESINSSSSSSSSAGPATTADECPSLYRPVPPYRWQRTWGEGTSWTWGPTTGDRGWYVEQLEPTKTATTTTSNTGDDNEVDDDIAVVDGDDWHGSAPVELWNLRLPQGGLFCQAPRVITSDQVGLCRVAWLPKDDTLLRLEAGVLALRPLMTNDDDDDEVVAFEPPSLASLRCDILKDLGELEDENDVSDTVANRAEEVTDATSTSGGNNSATTTVDPTQEAIRDAFQ